MSMDVLLMILTVVLAVAIVLTNWAIRGLALRVAWLERERWRQTVSARVGTTVVSDVSETTPRGVAS